MGTRDRLISYPEERALEDAAYTHGVTPVRIFAILLPVFHVEIKATITEAHPYELIDRYLELGIAEAGLRTAGELAEFLGLDATLVDRALRFLTATGHLDWRGDQVMLTGLGLASVRDKVRYERTREDRRKLYFDAFRCRPLTRPYYEKSSVRFLTRDEALAGKNYDGPLFHLVMGEVGFRPEALTELANAPDRDRFNLPERIDSPQCIGTAEVYLPVYIVRARQARGGTRHLVYSQVGGGNDPDLTNLCERTPELVALLDTEERATPSQPEVRAREWLRNRNLPDHTPVHLSAGMWRATLPGTAFNGSGAVPSASWDRSWCRVMTSSKCGVPNARYGSARCWHASTRISVRGRARITRK